MKGIEGESMDEPELCKAYKNVHKNWQKLQLDKIIWNFVISQNVINIEK